MLSLTPNSIDGKKFLALLESHENFLQGQTDEPVKFESLILTDRNTIQIQNKAKQIGLKEATFIRCDVNLKAFEGIDLSQTRFFQCEIKNVLGSFQNIRFEDCIFQKPEKGLNAEKGIMFTHCRFKRGCFQSGVNMEDAHFRDCSFLGTLFQMQWDGGTFEKCKLIKIIVEQGPILSKVTFRDCSICFKRFSGTIHKECIIENCFFKGSNFAGSTIYYELFDKIVREQTNLYGVTVTGHTQKFEEQEDVGKKNLKNLDMQGVRFTNLNLSKSSFRGSNLRSAVFRDVTLYKTDFREAVLRDAIFDIDETKSLEAKMLAGSDLLGATLPQNIKAFSDPRELLEAAEKNARNLFVVLVPLCFVFLVSWLTRGENGIEILVIPSTLSNSQFLITASLIIFALYSAMHVYLIKMFEQISYLPRRFQDGAPLTERIFPWILSSVVLWSYAKKELDMLNIKGKIKYKVNYYIILLGCWNTLETELGSLKTKDRIQIFIAYFFAWLAPWGVVVYFFVCFLQVIGSSYTEFLLSLILLLSVFIMYFMGDLSVKNALNVRDRD